MVYQSVPYTPGTLIVVFFASLVTGHTWDLAVMPQEGDCETAAPPTDLVRDAGATVPILDASTTLPLSWHSLSAIVLCSPGRQIPVEWCLLPPRAALPVFAIRANPHPEIQSAIAPWLPRLRQSYFRIYILDRFPNSFHNMASKLVLSVL